MCLFLKKKKKKSRGVVEEKEERIKMLENLSLLLPPSSYNGRQLPAPSSLCKLSKGRKNSTVPDIKKKNTFSLTDKLSSTFTQFMESKWVRHIVNLGNVRGKLFLEINSMMADKLVSISRRRKGKS
jgi:hypothetical protein